MKPILYIFSGLPGSGKTTLAREAAKILKAPYLRIDTIEHGLREICSVNVQGEGYRLTYRVAADNLRVGNDVIVDSCNPWELTRNEWEKVATDNDSHFINIEIVCSDSREHKTRIENRESDMPGFRLPTWRETQERDYHEWTRDRIVIETSGREVDECLAELLKQVNAVRRELS